VADGVVSAILTRVFTGEAETVRGGTLDWDRIVDKVNVAASPLFIIFNELIVEVASWKIIGTVLIVTYSKN
jgi:hypothetical protein